MAQRALLARMLRAAAAPYFGMLERWVCEGALDDPFHEFMVQEDVVRLSLSCFESFHAMVS